MHAHRQAYPSCIHHVFVTEAPILIERGLFEVGKRMGGTSPACEIWDIWDMGCRIWDMGYGIWDMGWWDGEW